MATEWSDGAGQVWTITVDNWMLLNGRYEPTGLTISLKSAHGWGDNWWPQPIGAALLRDLPIGRIITAQRAQLADELRAESQQPDSQTERLELEADLLTRPRTRKWSEHELEEVARVYRDAQQFGAPVKAVAERYGIAHSTAAKRVMAARSAGYLPPTVRGRSRA